MDKVDEEEEEEEEECCPSIVDEVNRTRSRVCLRSLSSNASISLSAKVATLKRVEREVLGRKEARTG